MKCDLSAIIGTECRNSNINHIWVLDADNANYFGWHDSSLPKIHKIKDSQRIAIAAAADGLMNGYAGICVLPVASVILESLAALQEINRNRIPLFVICFTGEDDSEVGLTISLLRSCNFFVQRVSDPENGPFRIANSLQYAIAEKRVSVLLIDRKLNGDTKYDKNHRYKVHHTSPVVIPQQDEITELAQLINAVSKLTIVCGEHCDDCGAEIKSLADTVKSPVVYMPDVKASLRSQIGFDAGIYGKWSEKSAIKAIQECELVLLLDYSEKNYAMFPDTPEIIQISPYFLNGVDAQQRKRVYSGDIKETLKQLLPSLNQKENSDFAQAMMTLHQENTDAIVASDQPGSSLARQISTLLNELTDQAFPVCSHGYNSFIFRNFFIKTSRQRAIHLSYELQSKGGILFEALGLNGGNKKTPVIVVIDSDTIYNELSSLVPLTNLDYPIKLLVLNKKNTDPSPIAHPFTYEGMCKAMHIPYFQLGDPKGYLKTLEEWIFSEGGGLLEVFDIDFSSDLLEETERRVIPQFSKAFEQALSDSLIRLHAGKYFYYQKALAPDKFHLPEMRKNLISVYSSRSVFYSAIGAANVSSDIPVCIATSLSDILQMMPGIREARRTHTPVLFLILASGPKDLFFRRELRMIYKLVQEFSAYTYYSDDPDKDLTLLIGEGIAEAQHLNGIATIVFDPTIYGANRLVCSEIFDSPYVSSLIYPSEEELDKIAKVINQSSYTVVFAGSGCRLAHKEVITLVRKLKAPLGWSFSVKDEFDYDNYYPVGMGGLLSNPGLEDALRKCEVLILLGSNLNFGNKISRNCQVIQIDKNPFKLGHSYPIDIGIEGEIKITLQKLLPRLITIGNNTFAEKSSQKYIEDRREYERLIAFKAEHQQGILMESVFVELDKLVPENAWIISDMIVPWYLTALNIQSKGGRRLFATGENLYTSNSSAFAVGALAAQCDKPLIVICTNTTFFKQMDNLVKLTQVQHNVKIFILHLWQDDQPVTYSKMHLSNHFMGVLIDSGKEMNRMMAVALGMPGPVIIDIPVLRKELIKSPPFMASLVQKYNLILRKLYVNSEKEEMLQTFGRVKDIPTPED